MYHMFEPNLLQMNGRHLKQVEHSNYTQCRITTVGALMTLWQLSSRHLTLS